MTSSLTEASLQWFLIATEGVGVLAFALSGVLAAIRKRLDVVGVVFVAFVTALGGGTLRDLLLDRQPFFWVAHQEWVWVVIALGVLGSIVLRARHFEPTFRAIQWPDAIGLGLFAASGTQIALESGSTPLIATLMGVVTAAVGGILRDVLLNEIPWVVASYQLYAVIAFAGGWLVWLLHLAGVSPALNVALSAVAISLVRILAIRFNWQLPNWRRDDHTGSISLP
jgi:uncharacterized membrane protein YeiH